MEFHTRTLIISLTCNIKQLRENFIFTINNTTNCNNNTTLFLHCYTQSYAHYRHRNIYSCAVWLLHMFNTPMNEKVFYHTKRVT